MTARRPSGVGLLAEVFVRLWHLTDEPRWREAAENLIRAVSGAPEGLGGSPLTLMSADMLERGGSVVIDGPLDDPRAQALAEGRARRARSVADRAAPRPATVAGRPAARRPAASRGADRHAVSGPDLQPAGDDAGGADRGDRGAAVTSSTGLVLKPDASFDDPRGSTSFACRAATG